MGKSGRCVRLTTLPPPCAVVTKSGNLKFLEPSGPLQACNGTDLPLPLPLLPYVTLQQASLLHFMVGHDSSVGIATCYVLDGPGIECLWGDFFRTRPDRLWGPHSLLYNGYRGFTGGKAVGSWR